MDADKLATSGHAPGVKVYNTNATPDATSQTLGFPASSAIGAYVLGASTFTRVAS